MRGVDESQDDTWSKGEQWEGRSGDSKQEFQHFSEISVESPLLPSPFSLYSPVILNSSTKQP
jgi:hypothetical protein